MHLSTGIRLELLGHAALPDELDPDEEGLGYGKTFAECRAALTAAAQRLNVMPLHRYASDERDLWEELEEEVLRDAEDDREAEDEIHRRLNERGDWHDPEDALHAIRALLQHYCAEPSDAPIAGRWCVRDVAWDLRAFQCILERARDDDRRFRFHIGM